MAKSEPEVKKIITEFLIQTQRLFRQIGVKGADIRNSFYKLIFFQGLQHVLGIDKPKEF